jgi:hypothetical protein
MSSLTNAKEEFHRKVKSIDNVRCARIVYESGGEDVERVIILKQGYTELELSEFLSALEFEYYSGYGIQYVFGYVWLKDGTWMERKEYDGAEWWVHKVCPNIPIECE